MRKAFILTKAFAFLLLLWPFSQANAQYCASNATSTGDSKIDSVYIGTTAFGSGASVCETYTDNSSTPAIPVLIGVPTDVRVVTGSCSGFAYTRHVSILVDWNNDSDFNDPGELLTVMGPTPASVVQHPFVHSLTVPAGTLPGNKRLRIVCVETSSNTATTLTTGCGTYTWGETEDYTINVISPVGTDAAAVNITSPAAPIAGGSQVAIAFNIGNFAANNITTATVGYQIDNNTPVTEPWSGNISTGNLSLHTFGSLATVPLTGTFTLKVWVTNANGAGPDNNINNDTVTVTRCIALPGGVYTIGGASADFPTISASVAAMLCGGISGPVTFNIFPGVYEDTINLAGIPGASSSTPLTYTSITGVASDVVIRRPLTSAPNSHVIRFANLPSVTLSNLTIIKTGTTQFVNNYVVLFDNGCDFSALLNCVLIDSNTNSTNFNARNVGFNAVDGITISGNTIRGGYYGIEGNGRIKTVANPTYNFGQTITDNIIDSTSNTSIYLVNQDFITVSNNLVRNPTFASSFSYGIFLSGFENATVNANIIRGSLGDAGIYLTNGNGDGATPNYITNNVVSGIFRSNTPKGIAVFGSVGLTATPINPRDAYEIANNSINLIYPPAGSSTSTFQGAIYISGGSATTPAFSSIGLYNNSIASYGTTLPTQYRALWVGGNYIIDSLQSNHNAFYLPNSTAPIIRNNTPAFDYTLQVWRDSTGRDLNSVNTDPNYLNANLLIPNNGALNDAGVQLGYVSTDIQGTPRPITPDIGAYEFTPSTFDAGVSSIQKPNNGCGLSATDTVMVTIQNFGSGAISNFPVAYVVNNGTPVIETFAGTINGGQTASYTFATTINLATPGTYNLIAYTSLASDGLSLNDSAFKTVTSIPVLSTFPYIEGFENGNGGWLVGGANPSWQLGTPNVTQNGVTLSTAAGGVNSWLTNLTGPYNNAEVSYVQSPCFNLTSLSNPEVEFNVFWDTESSWDGGNLAYSLDGGTTWLTVGTVGSGIFNWYTVAQVNSSLQQPVWANPTFGNTGPGTWVTAKHSLSNLAGQSQVLFRMRFYSDGSVNSYVGFGFDNFRVSDPPPADLSVMRVTSPVSACGLTANDTVKAMIRNFGSIIATNFPVAYSVNGGTPVVNTFTGSINPGDSALFTFTTTANFATVGTYNVRVFTQLVGDANNTNDTASRQVVSIPTISTLPYLENFDSGNGGWTVRGANPSWQLGTPNQGSWTSAFSAPNAWMTNLTGFYNNSEFSYVESPCINMTGVTNANFSFYIQYDGEPSWDAAGVEYSIDNGVTFQPLGAVGTGISNWYNAASVISSNNLPVWAGANGTGWIEAEHSLAALANQPFAKLRIRFTSDGSVNAYNGFAFDNVRIRIPVEPKVDSVTVLGDTCFSGPRTVRALVSNVYPLTAVNLLYSLTGAANPSTVAPMTFNASINRWVGTIPTGTPNSTITYRVSAIDSANFTDTSGIRSFKNEPLVISAGADTTINPGDTATLNASLGFNQGSLQITEVMFNRGGTGTQAVWPAYLPQTGFNDMFEITNLSFGPVPLGGLKLQVISNGTTINMDYALPNITLGGGERLMILPEAGVNDTVNNVYYAGLAFGDIINSGSAQATILYDSTTTTAVSAVIQTTGTFPATITVPASVYSGPGVTPTSGFAGFQRTSTATNTAADWAVTTAAAPSTMGALNPGLSAASLSWAPLGGASIGNNPTIQVTPNTTTTYVLTITALGCTRSDSVTVFVGSQNITDAAIVAFTSPNASNNSAPFGTPIPITIRCANVGNQPIPAGFDAGYTVNGVASTQTVTVAIPVGDTVNFTFSTPWTPTVGGNNTVCVYMVAGTIVGDNNFSNDTACVTILGVNTDKLENGIGIVSKVFPNPATDKVYFEIGADVKDGILMVYNNLGQVIANINVNDLSKGNMITLETSNYASGIYTFSLTNGDKVQSGRFVITR